MRLRNSFKFGFELEAFANIDDFCSNEYGESPCNSLNEDNEEDLEEFYSNINDFFKDKFGFKGYTHYDGSVKNYKDGYNSFEWSSPAIEFNTKNIMKVKRMLTSLKDYDIHINETCGFHTHFSYEGLNDSDAAWILLYVAMNPYALKLFTEFEYGLDDELFPMHTINFFNERYADKTFFETIKNAFLSKDYNLLRNVLNEEKYRVLRVHPQGTLEWRGPREFLYSNNGVEQYIKRLYEIIDIINLALDMNVIDGITRDEFIDNIRTVTFNHYRNDVNPEQSYIDKRHRSDGVFPWFGSSRWAKYVPSQEFNKIVSKVIEHPILITDRKYDPFITPMVRRLNDMNKLHTVISKAYKDTNGKLPVNLQYAMISNNITLLPYINDSIWKYMPFSAFRELIYSYNNFKNETEYKHKTIDFIFNSLTNHFQPKEILEILDALCQSDWMPKYIINMHYNKLRDLLIVSTKADTDEKKKKIEDRIKGILTLSYGFQSSFKAMMSDAINIWNFDNRIVTITSNDIASYATTHWINDPSLRSGRCISIQPSSFNNVYGITDLSEASIISSSASENWLPISITTTD